MKCSSFFTFSVKNHIAGYWYLMINRKRRCYAYPHTHTLRFPAGPVHHFPTGSSSGQKFYINIRFEIQLLNKWNFSFSYLNMVCFSIMVSFFIVKHHKQIQEQRWSFSDILSFSKKKEKYHFYLSYSMLFRVKQLTSKTTNGTTSKRNMMKRSRI
jgi:hypothetical protein